MRAQSQNNERPPLVYSYNITLVHFVLVEGIMSTTGENAETYSPLYSSISNEYQYIPIHATRNSQSIPPTESTYVPYILA